MAPPIAAQILSWGLPGVIGGLGFVKFATGIITGLYQAILLHFSP